MSNGQATGTTRAISGHPTRWRLLATIAAKPGCTKSDLCRSTGLSWGSIYHHITQFRAEGKIRLVQTDRRVFLYLADVPVDQLSTLRLQHDALKGTLLAHVRQEPGIGINALSAAVGLSRKIVRRHLNELVSGGLLDRTPDYRPRFSCVTASAHQAPPALAALELAQSG